MKNNSTFIPAYISSWTDKYFHQSAYDIPWKFPNIKVIKFLSKFKKDRKINLFRGVNEFNRDSLEIESWTYDKEVAKKYLGNRGKIIEKKFNPQDVLLDTTLLNKMQKILIGYDYKTDDKEVLILKNKK